MEKISFTHVGQEFTEELPPTDLDLIIALGARED